MLSGFAPVLLLMLGAWIWLDGARAREFATALVRRHCETHDLQFLDETVALARIGIRWTSSGLRIRRMFRFEFSVEGMGRHTGYILMLGMHLEAIDDGMQELRDDEPGRDDAPSPGTRNGQSSNVVPFRRRNK